MIILENWRYTVGMHYWQPDTWSLSGNVYNHPKFENGTWINTSSPVFFDKEKMQVKTHSGSLYQLGQCGDGNIERQIGYIEEDIKKGKE